ncbi:MAG: Asp-tRNA(Asn)/Glu-tRNA(Gln) amidotransferase subunit GatB [Patescibacteria group bacterium]
MEFKTVIGLEIHVQLKTKSKMFCGCDNKAEQAEPNSLVCPVCLGLPGVLPVANKQAIEWTLKTGLALNSKIANFSKFDRKHYFYPDSPKNYQISQYDMPFCEGGYLEIRNNKEEIRKISLTRIHLEEDAGKLIHADDGTLIDLNRAGTPLMEIVTNPDISSPEEAKIFMQELRSILRYLSVTEASMEKGHMRCDANISVSENKNDKWEMGVPVEIKNMNSFRMVERALLYEEKRQKELLEKGEKIVKETRGWNDVSGETYSQRSKEFAQDYRYFPEPDIPPFEISDEEIEEIRKEIPELPAEKRKRYLDWEKGFKIPTKEVADILVQEKATAEYFEKLAKLVHPVTAANWIINILGVENIDKVDCQKLGELLSLLENHKITGSNAKEVLEIMMETGKNASTIIQEKGITPPKDQSEIANIVNKVVEDNSKVVDDINNGKKEALGFLVGQVMGQMKGQADPKLVKELIENLIKFKKEL